MRFALFLIAACAAFAQVTPSTNTVAFGNARAVMFAPQQQKVFFTGSGNVSYAFSCTPGGANSVCSALNVSFCAGGILTGSSSAGGSVLNVPSTNGFSAGQSLVIGYGTSRFEGAYIASVGSGVLNLVDPLQFTHNAGDQFESDPCVSTAASPNVANFWLYGGNYYTIPAGSYTSTATLVSSTGFSTSANFTVTIHVVANNQSSTTITTASGSCTGCSGGNTNNWAYPNDVSPWNPVSLPAPTATGYVPSVGSSYVDGALGATVYVVGDPPTGTGDIGPFDSEAPAINSNGTLMFSGSNVQSNLIVPTGASRGTVVYTNMINTTTAAWDYTNPLVYWYMNVGTSNVIHKVTLNGVGGVCTGGACTDNPIYSVTGPTGVVISTRDTRVNKQGYWAAYAYVLLTVASITPGNPTVATITGTIPASVQPGVRYWIRGDGSCPALQNVNAKATAVASNTITFAVDTSSGCGSYNASSSTFKSDARLCAIRLSDGTQVCSAAQSASAGDYDTIAISNTNSADTQIYLMEFFNANGGGRVYSFNPNTDTSLTYRWNWPQQVQNSQSAGSPSFTGPCSADRIDNLLSQSMSAHKSVVEINGIQFIAAAGAQTAPTLNDIEFVRIDSGCNLNIDQEAGGGDYHSFMYAGPSQVAYQDDHVTAAQNAPVVVVSFDDEGTLSGGASMATVNITNVTIASGVPTITTSPNYPGANGDTVYISAVSGITNLNNTGQNTQFCTVAGLSGASFHCSNISTASGTYTPASSGVSGGVVVPSNASPTNYAHVQEIILVDATNLLSCNCTTVKRLVKSHSFASTNNYLEAGQYGSQPHPTMIWDGSGVAWNSNFGLPDYGRALEAATGYSQSGGPTGGIAGSGVSKAGVRR